MKKLIILSFFIFMVLSQLVRADIITDKEVYKPGELVNIELTYSKPLINAELKIIDPEGKVKLSKPMNNISSTHWNYSYTLSTKALNGTYTIYVTALPGEALINVSTPVLEFNKTFDVLAWRINAYLEKHILTPKEKLNLTFLITDRYSDKLTFDVFYSLKNPLGNEVVNYSFTLTGANRGFVEIYEIPENYTLGVSTITINLTDSDKRFSSTSLNFSVVKPLSISPEFINETITNKIFKKIIVFENFGNSDINVNSIEISENLKDIISIVQRPYLIPPNGRGIMEIEISTIDLSEGSYDGIINVYTSEGDVNPINISLRVVSPIKPSKPKETPQDYSYIIWYFAIAIVVVIIILTIWRYKKVKKKKEEEKKKEKKEEEKEEEIYYRPQEEYRTEYY